LEKLKEEIEDLKTLILRFVDDFDALFTDLEVQKKADEVFKEVGNQMKLKFTQEVEVRGEGLQFLDLKQSTKDGLCVEYGQRSGKPILSFESNHSKSVFEGIVIGALKNAVTKSCPCKVGSALEKQEERLVRAGYPRRMIEIAKRKVITKKPKKEWEVRRVGVAPNIHKLTNNLRRAGRDYNLQITSSYRNKLSTLPARTDRMRENREEECSKHKESPFPCTKDTIYEVKLKCGASYVGESSRCPNVRFSEHRTGKGATTTISNHIKKCKCDIDTKESSLIHDKPIRGAYARKLVEAIIMHKKAEELGEEKIISAISMVPTRRELEYITKSCHIPYLNKK
jgi:hypothetical protein